MDTKQTPQPENEESKKLDCSCSGDPFASLPPDQQPEKKSWKDHFRQVTCPACGKEYWTNKNTDLCSDCR